MNYQPIKCECGNEDQDKFLTQDAGTKDWRVLTGFKCAVCGKVHRP